MHYSAVSSMPSEIIKISNYSLKSILKGLKSIKMLKDAAKPFPPDKVIRK